ncbi:MAG: DUF6364 family protein [Candidatus Eremiobacteraeota bacterium]|nr:DUF6364 family protein [Candidatus Eremiobacteraeota bacterium]
MDSKLTLKLNKEAIKDAKDFARRNHISLSRMVEQFFLSLTEEPEGPPRHYTPLVRELSGIIQLEDNFDCRKEYREYLEEKYK